jgi:hypothetical protein
LFRVGSTSTSGSADSASAAFKDAIPQMSDAFGTAAAQLEPDAQVAIIERSALDDRPSTAVVACGWP